MSDSGTSPIGAGSGVGGLTGPVATDLAVATVDEHGFAPDHLGLPLQGTTLRPNTHRRISVRGTPGTSIEVALRAHQWLSLEVLDASRAPAPRSGGGTPTPPVIDPGTVGTAVNPTVASAPTTPAGSTSGGQPGGQPGGFVGGVGPAISGTTTTASAGSTPGRRGRQPGSAAGGFGPDVTISGGTSVAQPSDTVIGPGADPVVETLALAARRPPLGSRLRPGGVFDPFDPTLPIGPDNPLPPLPPKPTLPIEVVISRRDGAELGRTTLQAVAGSPSPARFEVTGISGHDVLDVTFINPNPVPAILSTCAVFVDRRVRTTTTRLSTELLLRAFNGAVESLAPEITASDGQVRVALHGDLADELKINNVTFDTPVSFDGGATFEATDLEIMGLGELVPLVVNHLQADLLVAFPSVLFNLPDGEKIFVRDRADAVATPDFVAGVVEAYFDRTIDLESRVAELVATDSSRLGAKRLRSQARTTLDRYPFLTDDHEHTRADPGFAVSYALTGIHGDFGAVGIELDEIRASLFLAMHHVGGQVPAPFGDLPLDRLTVGSIFPTGHLDLDISDFDIDLDVPLWADILSLGTITLGTFLLEQGLEALANFLAGIAEREIPAAFHRFVSEHAEAYGHLIAQTLTTIADRDHHLYRAAANRDQIAIATIDPNQLRVPHDPSAIGKRSPVAGIGVNLPPITPLATPAASPSVSTPVTAFGSTPEQLLDRIDHFVFVMMENRSFDHMLGYLSHPAHGGRSDVDGLDGSDRALGGDFEGTRATPLPGPNPRFWPNLPHDHRSIVRQINGGAMNGFASEYGRKLMRQRGVIREGFINDAERPLRFETPDVVSTYDYLAREFTICDRWFASVPAGTYPNRACYYSGATPALENDEIAHEFGYLKELTVFDVLTHVGVDWKVFESDISFLRVFDRYRIDTTHIRPLSELGDPMPTVTFIDPNFTGFPSPHENNDDQPDTDVRNGQAFIADIVDRVMNSSHWDSTMLVITYDEHGGFADHVPPPGAPGSSHPPDGGTAISRSHPDASTYGVRVPAFIVSPFAARGGVAHQIFDHATVFKTLVQRFAPQHVNSAILPERVRRSRHLGEALRDLPPRVVTAMDVADRPAVLASQRRRARVSFDEPLDIEDAAGVLRRIAVPGPTR